jgi:hypothetical protein
MENLLKINCSQIGIIMSSKEGITKKQLERITELKAKENRTENQNIELFQLLDKENQAKKDTSISETAKTLIREIWLKDKFGYKEIITTPEMQKGNISEQDSFSLIQSILKGQFRISCKTKYEGKLPLNNEFLKGIPDIDQDSEDLIEEIKTPYTIKTFMDSELIKLYEYQIRGYLSILNRSKGRLIYALVPTPKDIIISMQNRVKWQYGGDERNPDYIKISEQIEFNHITCIELIPPEKRIKVFEVTRDIEIENKIYEQVKKCRSYYNQLSL